jgi:hypothetical protein
LPKVSSFRNRLIATLALRDLAVGSPRCAKKSESFGETVLAYLMGDKSDKDRHKKATQKNVKDATTETKKRGNTEQQHHPTAAFSLPVRAPRK